MEITIQRTYYPEGTNGDLFINDVLTCHTIELPWVNNERRISCIPEGKYRLIKHFSSRFGAGLQVMNVPNRDGILIHAANNALKELKGCIAPVSNLEGPGKGNKSKPRLLEIFRQIYPAINNGEKVYITIKKA